MRVEPTDQSRREAVDFARETEWDGFVAIGGGSSIDTAKAINLLTTNPGDLMDYINKPAGDGKAPTEPLKPLIAVPTTAGTGSESTAMCILDVLALRVKTGISHPRLRPVLAVVDPLTTLTVPPHVTAATGLDVLCHALESYTARHYLSYARRRPEQRAVYVGSNPVSDAFIEKALPLLSRSFRRAVLTGHDLAARTDMMMAASFAEIHRAVARSPGFSGSGRVLGSQFSVTNLAASLSATMPGPARAGPGLVASTGTMGLWVPFLPHAICCAPRTSRMRGTLSRLPWLTWPRPPGCRLPTSAGSSRRPSVSRRTSTC